MSDPYLYVPIFSWPAAPGGLLYTYYAGGTVFAPTYAASGAINTNPVILDATGSAAVRRDPNISYHFVLKDSTGASTIWDADNFPVDAVLGTPTTIAAAATVDLGTAPGHSALVHGSGATITSFGTSASTATPFYVATFDGANTLTNSSTLTLPGGGNIVTVAGDALFAQFSGTGWNVLFYQQGFVSGTTLAGETDYMAIKSSDQSITSNATLFADAGLVTPSLAVGNYEYELLIGFYANNNSNGGLKFQIKQAGNVVGGISNNHWPVSIVYNANGSGGTVAAGLGAQTSFATLTNGPANPNVMDWCWVRGLMQISSAGPVQLYWSQNTSSTASTTLKQNSFLRVRSPFAQA